jgi:hypothetical protein
LKAFLPISRASKEPFDSNYMQAKSIESNSLALAITKLSIPFPTGAVFLGFLIHFLKELADN